MNRLTRCTLPVLVLLASYQLHAQVTSDRIRRAAAEPRNWLTYGGTYTSQRYSLLDKVTPANVTQLESKWVLQNQVFGAWQSTPLVVDGIMYVTQRPNDVLALDAKTGRVFWLYRYTPSPDARVCCGSNNRGERGVPELTPCSWARSTRTWWRSTRRTGVSSGTPRSPT